MKVAGAELVGDVASVSAPSGGSLSAAGLKGSTPYSADNDTGWDSSLFACTYGNSDSGTDQGWYRSADGSQVYSDSAGNTAVDLDEGSYYWLSNGGSIYSFFITAVGIVKTGKFGTTTNLDDTSSNVSC